MTNTITLARNPAYEDDDSEPLITKATWPLKVSGLLFACMLVLGRSASHGNITWTPTHHAATSPLVVVHQTDGSSPAPALPKSAPLSDLGALSKRTAADEVVTFSPGSNSGDDGDNALAAKPKDKKDQDDKDKDKDKDKDAKTTAAVNNHSNEVGAATANSPKDTATETAGEDTGQATASVKTAKTAHETQAETAGEATGQQTVSVKTANTANDTKAETAGEASGQATASANAANGNNKNNGHDNGQVHDQGNRLDAEAQAAWFAQSEESPWLVVGAVGGLMTLIGLAFLKPWRFLRRFSR